MRSCFGRYDACLPSYCKLWFSCLLKKDGYSNVWRREYDPYLRNLAGFEIFSEMFSEACYPPNPNDMLIIDCIGYKQPIMFRNIDYLWPPGPYRWAPYTFLKVASIFYTIPKKDHKHYYKFYERYPQYYQYLGVGLAGGATTLSLTCFKVLKKLGVRIEKTPRILRDVRAWRKAKDFRA